MNLVPKWGNFSWKRFLGFSWILKNYEKLWKSFVKSGKTHFFSWKYRKSHLLPRFLPISRSNFAVNFSSSTSHSSWTRFKTFFSSFSLCSINCLYNLKNRKKPSNQGKFREFREIVFTCPPLPFVSLLIELVLHDLGKLQWVLHVFWNIFVGLQFVSKHVEYAEPYCQICHIAV